MKQGIGFIDGYRTWLNDESNRKELRDYAEAMWIALCDPDQLNKDTCLLYRAYALMQVCLSAKRRQYMYIRDIARRDQFGDEEVLLCLFGKLIQKLLEAKPGLEHKKSQLSRDEFNRYIFTVAKHILGKCMAELSEEILGNNAERQAGIKDFSIGSTPPSLEILQYRLDLRRKADKLRRHLEEHWQTRELNVLCHDLEKGGARDSLRLSAESRDNIYQLHKRIRDKLKKTISEQGFDEEVGRLFIGRHLQDLCQNCAVLHTYKDTNKAIYTGGNDAV